MVEVIVFGFIFLLAFAAIAYVSFDFFRMEGGIKRRRKIQDKVDNIAESFANNTKDPRYGEAHPVYFSLPINCLFSYTVEPTSKKEYSTRMRFLGSVSTFVDSRKQPFEHGSEYRLLCAQFSYHKRKESFDLEVWQNFFDLLNSEDSNKRTFKEFSEALVDVWREGSLKGIFRQPDYSIVEEPAFCIELYNWIQQFVEDQSIASLPLEWQVDMVATDDRPERTKDLPDVDGGFNARLKYAYKSSITTLQNLLEKE